MISFYKEKIGLVDEGKAVILCLNLRKDFDTVSHKFITDELLIYGLDEKIVRWIES